MSISQNYPTIAPSLSLDFANVKKLDPRITFARASTGAYYDGQTVAKAEENLLLQSQTFDNAYWTKTNITVTANSTTAPDGTTTAESILETATTGSHQVFRNAVITSSNTHVRSVFAKPNGRNWLAIYGGAGRSFFDLQNGVTGTVEAGYTASMIDAGNGWYRCILIGPAGTSSYAGLYNIADADNSISYAGDITKGLFIWGAQFEQRSSVTAYTPTTTQPITNYIPVLQTASANVARFDHNPVTGESLGLLVEEQRTNLLLRSEEFDNAYWLKSNATITSNTVIAPDGTLTGDKLVENTANATHFIYSGSQAFVSGTSYTLSVYAKKGERQYLVLQLPSAAFPSASNATFDLDSATFNLGAGSPTASITDVGNGVYRCSITKTATSSASSNGAFIYVTNSASATINAYTGDGYSGIYIWGAQVEAGAFPTSYIPTVASQVTRSADSASMTGTNFSDWYRADEGSFYAEGSLSSGTRYISLISSNLANQIEVIQSGSGVNLFVYTNSSVQMNTTPSANAPLTPNKVAFAYKTNDCAGSVNSGAVTTDTSVVLPLVSKLQLSGNGNGSRGLGHYKKLAYYPTRLSNTQLQALTS
jgi:hypothetical protein